MVLDQVEGRHEDVVRRNVLSFHDSQWLLRLAMQIVVLISKAQQDYRIPLDEVVPSQRKRDSCPLEFAGNLPVDPDFFRREEHNTGIQRATVEERRN